MLFNFSNCNGNQGRRQKLGTGTQISLSEICIQASCRFDLMPTASAYSDQAVLNGTASNQQKLLQCLFWLQLEIECEHYDRGCVSTLASK